MKHVVATFAVLWVWMSCSAVGAQAPVPKTPDEGFAVEDVIRLVGQAQVERSLKEFTQLESRVLGYPGNAQAAELVVEQLQGLGYDEIKVDEFTAAVPMDRGASLEVPDLLAEPLKMYPLWPNLVRTSQLPREGSPDTWSTSVAVPVANSTERRSTGPSL